MVPTRETMDRTMRLTDTACRKLPVPEKGYKISYDDEVSGFGLRVTSGDARTFILNYRCRSDHRQRQLKIGAFPAWTTQAARARAKELRRDIDVGADPASELETLRAGPTANHRARRSVADHLEIARAQERSDDDALRARDAAHVVRRGRACRERDPARWQLHL